MKQKSVKGECLCGAVKFEIYLPTKWCAHCHCTLCRRSHGAAFVTWFGVDDDQFKLIRGEEKLKWFHSSKESKRGFCSHCGSHILFRSVKWLGEIHITLSNMTGAIDRQPQAHAFFDTHVSWLEFEDKLPRYNDPALAKKE